MSSFQFSNKSLSHLSYAHPDLKRVMLKAIKYSKVDFGVFFPVRTKEDQANMLQTGASTTLNSRHLKRPQEDFVHAVDVYAWIDGKVSWDMSHYKKIAKAVFRAAIEEGVQLEWGGHWTEPEDGPHFQLAWHTYP